MITIYVGLSPLLFAQEIPSDQKLLQLTNVSAVSNPDLPKNLNFRIAFKDTVRIEREKILLVICRAPGGRQHGHQLGWQNLYYLGWNGHDWSITQSFEESFEGPLGDVDSMKIVPIGKTKNALFGMFLSTGNHHFEKTIGIALITWDGLQYIGSLELDYTNSAFMGGVDSTAHCPYYTYESSYQVEKSEKDWWDIKVKRTTKAYLAGCKENGSKKETLTYSFNGEKYLQMEP